MVKPVGNEDYVHVVMPMFVQWWVKKQAIPSASPSRFLHWPASY